MAEELPESPDSLPEQIMSGVQKPESKASRKRELKSAKRKGGAPALKKKPKKSKKWWWIGFGAVVLFFTAVFLAPKIGTIRYGICKTYIELHDPYPGFIGYVQAEEYGDQVIIDYNRTDAFGQRTLNQMRCNFRPEGLTAYIASVDLNGKANVYPLESKEAIDKFNEGVTSLLENQPSLIMPKGFPDDIKDYK